MNVIKKTVSLPDGREISIETGKLAKQADGAVMLRMGNTMLLATVCAAQDAVPGTDFMPLQCDYRERFSAAGRFPVDLQNVRDVLQTTRFLRADLWIVRSVLCFPQTTTPKFM